MISLSHVSKVYPSPLGPIRVLDDISMDIPSDRNVGILGRNGSGKSTLLRLLARAEAPSAGRIVAQVRLSWPMGFAGGFQGSLSGIDNIRFISRIHGVDWRRVVASVAEFSELGDFLRLPVNSYSSGMRARLNVGMSLAIRFDTYLIDEIPGVGDARFQRRFNEAFERIKNESSLILVSHNPEMIRKHCDLAMLVSGGKLIRFNDVEDALKVYANE